MAPDTANTPPDSFVVRPDDWEKAALQYLDEFAARLKREPQAPSRVEPLADFVLLEQSFGSAPYGEWTAAHVDELVASHDPRDVLAREPAHVLRLRDAMRAIAEPPLCRAPVDANLVAELHHRLQDPGVFADCVPGRFKEHDNEVILYSAARDRLGTMPTAAAHSVRDELAAALGRHMNRVARGDMHPLLSIGALECTLLWIHPFADGNGRVAQLLSTLLAVRLGYEFTRLVGIAHPYVAGSRYTRYFLTRLTTQATYLARQLYD